MSRILNEPYPRRMRHSKDSHSISAIFLVALGLAAYLVYINLDGLYRGNKGLVEVKNRVISAVGGK